MQLEGAPEGATEVPVQPEQQVDIDGLVATLDKLQIRDSQHLEGLHRTASAHGSTAQELGAARQQIGNLQREMEALKRAPTRQPDEFGDPYEQQQPLDLQTEIFRANDRWYEERVLRPQQQQSEAYWRDVETVQNSEYFPLVQDEYDAHMRTPAVARALSQGATSHTNEFHKVVGRKFKDIAQNLKSAADMLKEQSPKGEPPHMETGQVAPEMLPARDEEQRKQLEAIQKAHQGRDEDLDAQLAALLPDGDPILDL
jgi:hypothetical protein